MADADVPVMNVTPGTTRPQAADPAVTAVTGPAVEPVTKAADPVEAYVEIVRAQGIEIVRLRTELANVHAQPEPAAELVREQAAEIARLRNELANMTHQLKNERNVNI